MRFIAFLCFPLSDASRLEYVSDLIGYGLFHPGEVTAEDAFDDPVIGGCGWADAHANVDLPLGGDVQVCD